MISSIRSFKNYLETPESKRSEASIRSSISISDEWMKTFKETQAQGRLDMYVTSRFYSPSMFIFL